MKKRSASLDLIRVLAMLTVVLYHFVLALDQQEAGIIYPKNLPPVDLPNAMLGDIGVSMFFTLSGAALMLSYGSKKFNLREYTLKRFKSLFPAFWLGYAAVFCFYFIKNGGFSSGLHPGWFILTLIGMDGYTAAIHPNFYMIGEWFLGCIILLYAVFPILLWGIRKNQKITILVTVLLWFVPGLFLKNFKGLPGDEIFFYRIPEFLAGMLLVKYKEKILQTKWIIPMICTSLLLVFTVWDFTFIQRNLRLPVVCLPLTILLFYLGEKYLKAAWIRKILETIGKYCYAVFLVHHVVINEVVSRFYGTVIGRKKYFFVMMLVSLITAVLAVILQYITAFILKLMTKKK